MLADFVNQGGGLLGFSNTTGLMMGDRFGAVAGWIGSGNASIIAGGSPVVSGPFGVVSGTFSIPWHLTFADVGPHGSAFWVTSGAIGASFEVGAGRAVLFTDEEWCMNLSQAGCASGRLPNAQLENLFMNAFAYVIPPVPVTAAIEQCCYANCDRSFASPVLNVDDFTCFINAFAAGCP